MQYEYQSTFDNFPSCVRVVGVGGFESKKKILQDGEQKVSQASFSPSVSHSFFPVFFPSPKYKNGRGFDVGWAKRRKHGTSGIKVFGELKRWQKMVPGPPSVCELVVEDSGDILQLSVGSTAVLDEPI